MNGLQPSQRGPIVVIDDEPAIRRVLTHLLTLHGFTCEVASDGEEGLALVRSLKPRLVFLDVMMPRMSGHEVCARIKADPELSHTYVVMLTASVQQTDRAQASLSGADEFMPKPFSPREVAERVRNLLGPNPLAAAS